MARAPVARGLAVYELNGKGDDDDEGDSDDPGDLGPADQARLGQKFAVFAVTVWQVAPIHQTPELSQHQMPPLFSFYETIALEEVKRGA
ncbi:MAG: hypothetical protein A3A43_03295 [Candidatus Liptonbacteria bacterium RIFCSPLOWO2_01_FULL_56_20]|uniref:Uncharacterized protein n=1 Tax=Candidatus Liptonbacteria bacterium RIFCSPLOWO2_01_FULL_56_20 TaxID=1798652 RepID=A0A1G2CM68_9BACT|nr:MAG: hypothetical protein A2681_01540 [Candidatus Liptonbacteria bacterium RIFCSPHIGHO2_01_FULL_56_18b]OGZ01850.1 MAG: hypothetical protein A3A43_03295 [Candidatus Liptonbacteria bacterium RIFCSPLOWO2_01_FULL_56_20]